MSTDTELTPEYRLLADQRASRSDDLLSALLAAEDDGNRLSQDEALATAFSGRSTA